MKKFLKCFVVAAIMLTMIPFNVQAASGNAYLTGSASSVRAGNTTTIRLGFNGSDKVAGVQYTVSTSGSLEIVSINGLNGVSVSRSGNNVIQAVFATEGLNSGSAWADIVVKVPSGSKAGSKGTLTISNIGMSLDNNPSTLYANSVSKTITVMNTSQNTNTNQPVAKSSDATLKSLLFGNVDGFIFDKDIFEYTINVGYEVTSLTFTATTNDPKATYVVKGNENFAVGHNLVTITVTAEDGTTKDYKLDVIRAAKEVEETECPKCDTTDGNEKLIWIIISTILALLLIAETGYVIYDKQRD